jgi:hypothetical protein
MNAVPRVSAGKTNINSATARCSFTLSDKFKTSGTGTECANAFSISRRMFFLPEIELGKSNYSFVARSRRSREQHDGSSVVFRTLESLAGEPQENNSVTTHLGPRIQRRLTLGFTRTPNRPEPEEPPAIVG